MSSLSAEGLPRIRVALYGPSATGKSLFFNAFLRGEVRDISLSDKPVEQQIKRTYRMRTRVMGDIGKVDYILRLIDVPGKPEHKDARLRSLRKICGYIFFYDSTNPESVEALREMISEELKAYKKLKSMLAAIVAGTKKDLGPNRDAIWEASNLVDDLSETTMTYYGYRVPHLLISCKNLEEVNMVFQCLESIIFEMRPNPDIILRIGHRPKIEEHIEILETLEGLEEVPRMIGMPEKARPETLPKVEIQETRALRRYPIFRLNDNPRMWNLAKALTILFPDVKRCYIMIRQDNTYIVSHNGVRILGSEEERVLLDIIKLVETSDRLGKSRIVWLKGRNREYLILRGKAMIVMQMSTQ